MTRVKKAVTTVQRSSSLSSFSLPSPLKKFDSPSTIYLSMKKNSTEFGSKEEVPDLEESSATGWTDEKHSLYLKSIEASFVNQHYHFMDLPGSAKKPHNCPSSQCKVLRDGLWHDLSLKRPDSRLNKADDLHSILTSPWIRRFGSASKLHRCRQTRGLKKKESITSEVLDQNFDDEAVEQGHSNAVGKGCSYGSSKRMKSTSLNETSSSFDQVVPL